MTPLERIAELFVTEDPADFWMEAGIVLKEAGLVVDCDECGNPVLDNPGDIRCRTCADWVVTGET